MSFKQKTNKKCKKQIYDFKHLTKPEVVILIKTYKVQNLYMKKLQNSIKTTNITIHTSTYTNVSTNNLITKAIQL